MQNAVWFQSDFLFPFTHFFLQFSFTFLHSLYFSPFFNVLSFSLSLSFIQLLSLDQILIRIGSRNHYYVNGSRHINTIQIVAVIFWSGNRNEADKLHYLKSKEYFDFCFERIESKFWFWYRENQIEVSTLIQTCCCFVTTFHSCYSFHFLRSFHYNYYIIFFVIQLHNVFNASSFLPQQLHFQFDYNENIFHAGIFFSFPIFTLLIFSPDFLIFSPDFLLFSNFFVNHLLIVPLLL